MAKSKTFKVRVEGKTFELVGFARLILSDGGIYPGSSDYNNPRIALTVAPQGSTSEYQQIQVVIEFQRNLIQADRLHDKPASGYMDTKRPWSESYGGHIELSSDGQRLDLGRKQDLRTEDKVREAISVAIGKEQTERNLWAVSTCACERAIKALEYLGAPVDRLYALAGERTPTGLRNAVPYTDQANRKARETASERAASEVEAEIDAHERAESERAAEVAS